MSEQPPDSGAPRQPYNPYAQPDAPSSQPLWQGTRAPEQGASGPEADGHERRLWLIALVMLLVAVVAGAALTAAVLAGDDDKIAVTDLEAGQCFDADNLGEERGKVESIRERVCADEHDAEVFRVLEPEDGEDLEATGQRCVMELALLGVTWADLSEKGIEVRPLAVDAEGGEPGDVICFIRSRDGSPLTGSEFE